MKNKKIYYLQITPMQLNIPTEMSVKYGDEDIGYIYEVLSLKQERILFLPSKNKDASVEQVVFQLLDGSNVILMNGATSQEYVENRFGCTVIAHEDEVAEVFINEYHGGQTEIFGIDSDGTNIDYAGFDFPIIAKMIPDLLQDKKIIVRSVGRAKKISQCHQMFVEMKARGEAFDAQLSGLPMVEDSLDNEKVLYIRDTPHLSFDEALTVLSKNFSDSADNFNVIGVSDDVVV